MIQDFIFSGAFVLCGNRPPCHWSVSTQGRPVHNVLSAVASHDAERHGDEWPGVIHEFLNEARREVRVVREVRNPGNDHRPSATLQLDGVRPSTGETRGRLWPDSEYRALQVLATLRSFLSWRNWSVTLTATPGSASVSAGAVLLDALTTKRSRHLRTLKKLLLHGNALTRSVNGERRSLRISMLSSVLAVSTYPNTSISHVGLTRLRTYSID